MVSKVFMICDRYESGYGHGIKNDGQDGSKTPHGDPEHREAYQIGYDAGLRKFTKHGQVMEIKPLDEWDIDPAFPVFDHCLGMSLLDYFAGQAMQEMLHNEYCLAPEEHPDGIRGIEASVVAKKCYFMAEAMMAERNRRSEVI